MRPTEIKIGSIYFVAITSGADVHVTTMGEGPIGHRPLCGQIRLTHEEWADLIAASRMTDRSCRSNPRG